MKLLRYPVYERGDRVLSELKKLLSKKYEVYDPYEAVGRNILKEVTCK